MPATCATPPAFDAATAATLGCPACRGELRAEAALLVCAACHLGYPVVDGIPALVAARAEPMAQVRR